MVDEQDTAIHLPVAGNLTYREIHAFVDGVYCGYRDHDTDEYNDYERERHYWRAGWLAGHEYRRFFTD